MMVKHKRSRRLSDVLCWLVTRKPIDWPEHVDVQPRKITFEHVQGSDLRVTFINHSTVLIQTQGVNFLTDPIWSQRAGPFGIFGPKRVGGPGVLFEDLPRIDYVLISHNHYDHLDLPTVKRLQKGHDPEFFVGMGNRRFLLSHGVRRVTELSWWQEKSLAKDLLLAFVPAEHYARRGLLDHNRTLWGGFVIKSPHGSIYFAGDTGMGAHINEIQRFCGVVRLALLPVGAYSPRWFMGPVHMSPDDAVKAHRSLEAIVSIGIHFGTFQLGDEGFDDPKNELRSALRRYKITPEAFRLLEPGESLDIPLESSSKNV